MKIPRKSPLLALSLLSFSALAFAGETVEPPLQTGVYADGKVSQDPSTLPRSRSTRPPRRNRPGGGAVLPALVASGEGDWTLRGGWRLQSALKAAQTGFEISKPGFDAGGWYGAVVPGTELTSLVADGVYPDPTYGLNNLAIPEEINRDDYWYRQQFNLPVDPAGRVFTLRFDGVNYAADIWLNGAWLGATRGAFQRGEFDVTGLLVRDGPNTLAVRVSPLPHPGIPHEQSMKAGAGPNGGAATQDGPTFFSTEGWDWIPGIRDRDAGIWQDVHLHASGAVRLGDVRVTTGLPLPALAPASVSVSVELENRSATAQTVTVAGEFEGGRFSATATVPALSGSTVVFGPGDQPALAVQNPRLWWPNGYGSQELYHMTLRVADPAGRTEDAKAVRFGIRELGYELSVGGKGGTERRVDYRPQLGGGRAVFDPTLAVRTGFKPSSGPYVLLARLAPGADSSPALGEAATDETAPFIVFLVNGRRIACRGGNWGIDDALKRSSRERLEPFVRLERDAHFNMIRNWCGQSTEETLFDLCDEYGLLVWNDFWISTTGANAQPLDLQLYLANARDVVRRYRNHPSIALWCGRNEGTPPPYLNRGLEEIVRREDGSRYYLPSSTMLNTLSSGPYDYRDPVLMFSTNGRGFTTEMGVPSVPGAEAVRAMMPAEDQWPIGDAWAYHDWHQDGNGAVGAYMAALAAQFGEPVCLEDFCRKAQMLNYVNHRAMFEGLNAHLWAPSTGRLMWMSHPAWPSTVWQLYSSDYEGNGAYYGAMKACEPLHVQFDLDDRAVVVSNTTLEPVARSLVSAVWYDLAGRELGRQEAPVAAPADGTARAFTLDELPRASQPLAFLRLRWTDGGRILSDNFYWLPQRDQDNRLLDGMPRAILGGTAARDGNRIRVTVLNSSPGVALMVKPTLRDRSGQRILPAYASDGDFSLLPGERRDFTIQTQEAGAGAEVTLEGWNTSGTIGL